MEENEYKSTYDEITRIPCGFEKALTNNRCRCSHARHFWLADREGYACRTREASGQCARLLKLLRTNSRFSLKLPAVGSRLPHNMDIRVQAGGLAGIQRIYGEQGSTEVTDVRKLVETAATQAGGLEQLKFDEIMRSVTEFKVRKRKKNNEK